MQGLLASDFVAAALDQQVGEIADVASTGAGRFSGIGIVFDDIETVFGGDCAVGFIGGEAVLEYLLKDRLVDAAINGSFVWLGFVLEDAGHYAASSV